MAYELQFPGSRHGATVAVDRNCVDTLIASGVLHGHMTADGEKFSWKDADPDSNYVALINAVSPALAAVFVTRFGDPRVRSHSPTECSSVKRPAPLTTNRARCARQPGSAPATTMQPSDALTPLLADAGHQPRQAQFANPSLTRWPHDCDMLCLKIETRDLPEHMHLDYRCESSRNPVTYAERPKTWLLGATSPLVVYLTPSSPSGPQAWKEDVCRVFTQCGIEVAIPSDESHDHLFKGNFPICSSLFKRCLLAAGASTVHIGRHGMKQYMNILTQVPRHLPCPWNAIDIGEMLETEGSIVLWGFQPQYLAGDSKFEEFGLKMKVYPLLPFAAGQGVDKFVFGTIDIRQTDASHGSPEGKFIQCYAGIHHARLALTKVQPIWPQRMFDIANRKIPLQSYSGKLMEEIEKCNRARIEVRQLGRTVRHPTLDGLYSRCTGHFDFVYDLIRSNVIRTLILPFAAVREAIQRAWVVCEHDFYQTFAANFDYAGPSASDHKACWEFHKKACSFSCLQSSLGFGDGHFSRYVVAEILLPQYLEQRNLQEYKHWSGAIGLAAHLKAAYLQSEAVPQDQPPTHEQAPANELSAVPSPWLTRRRVQEGLANAFPEPVQEGSGASHAATSGIEHAYLQNAQKDALRSVFTGPDPPTGETCALPAAAVDHLLESDLSEVEKIILTLMPDKRCRAKKGDAAGTGKYRFFYKNGWGKQDGRAVGLAQRPSCGYASKHVMVRAIFAWAGNWWARRVVHNEP